MTCVTLAIHSVWLHLVHVSRHAPSIRRTSTASGLTLVTEAGYKVDLHFTAAWLLGHGVSNLTQRDDSHLLLAQATALRSQQQQQTAAAVAATLRQYACAEGLGRKQPSALGLPTPAL